MGQKMLTILLSLLKRFYKEILIVIISLSILLWAYNTVYDRGVDSSNTKWIAKVEKQEKIRDAQIASIEGLSKVTLEQTLINNDKTREDLAIIYKKLLGKPTTIIKDGKCVPSTDFISAYNEIISRGNIR